MKMTCRDMLHSLRKLGFSTGGLARKMGVNRAVLQLIWRGQTRRPHPRTRDKLSNIYDRCKAAGLLEE